MRFLVIIDPPAGLSPTSDTSIAIMDELHARGHAVAVCQLADLWIHGDEVGAATQAVTAVSRTTRPALVLAPEAVDHELSRFHAVLMRKDPPYDEAYHMATLLLEKARGKTLLFNDPRGLREANEKLYIFHFPELLAPTIVERRADKLRAFMQQQGGAVMIKPLDGFGGGGIFLLQEGDRNGNVILEVATDRGRRPVMAQRYLPEAREGDKRVLLLDGEPVGVLLRLPHESDHRSNLAVGGRGERGELSERDWHIIRRVQPRLRRDGLHFVGLDIVGGYLTEVNVTSPTGVQAIDRITGARIEARIVDWLERSAPQAV